MSVPQLAIAESFHNDDDWLTHIQIKQMSEQIETKVKAELTPIIQTLKEENKSLLMSLETRRQSCDMFEATAQNQAGIILREREKLATLERDKTALEEEIRILKGRLEAVQQQIPVQSVIIATSQLSLPKTPITSAPAPNLLQAFERAEHARRHSRQHD